MDIDNIVDSLGKAIDPKIKGLVKAINDLNISTDQSCEGHKDWGLNYPWIDIPDYDLKKIKKYIRPWNRNSDIRWGFKNSHTIYYEPVLGKETIAYRLRPMKRKEHSLGELQKNAINLANYLNNFKK